MLSAANLSDRDCIVFFYGVLTLDGIPGTEVPSSLVDLYIAPSEEIDPEKAWMSISGNPIEYDMMIIRFGITSPENFPTNHEVRASHRTTGQRLESRGARRITQTQNDSRNRHEP